MGKLGEGARAIGSQIGLRELITKRLEFLTKSTEQVMPARSDTLIESAIKQGRILAARVHYRRGEYTAMEPSEETMSDCCLS